METHRRPRRPWLAALANLTFPPLGHIYAGTPLRGIILTCLATLVAVGALSLTLWPRGLVTVVFMAILLILAYVTPIVDAVIVSRRRGTDYRLKRYNRWYVYLSVFALVVMASTVLRSTLRSHLVQPYQLPSGSMIPSLLVGDYILTDKLEYKSRPPQRFDVVVFEFPKDPAKTFVDRIIGLAGETIEIRDKQVFINGTALVEPHAYFSEAGREKPVANRDSFGPFRIPADSYFILGDNRDRSNDSRFWGPVYRDKIYGVVRLIYFSWDAENAAVRWHRIGTIVQ